MRIRPSRSIRGTISVPGDKSVSHRAAIIGAMTHDSVRIQNFLQGEDCLSTLNCLRQLGVKVEQNGTRVTVHGVGKTGFLRPSEPLDCGNSGTTMRLMAGILAGQSFESVLTGDDSLRKRPMGRIIEPLTEMGALIESRDGFSPLTIQGRNPLTVIAYETPVSSAQLKSCVMLAALNADGVSEVREAVQTRDHTERMFRHFGVETWQNGKIAVDGRSTLKAADIVVPGDISSAAFFIVAAAILPDSEIEIQNVGINGSRAYLLEKLKAMGVEVNVRVDDTESFEPVADLTIRERISARERAVISGREAALLIDELPILAVLGTQLECGLEVRDAKELRIKETDRIAAICENLRRMNATVEEFDDGFRVEKSQLKGAEIDSFGDHRIAMAFAVAGLVANGQTKIRNAECADISFPGFYELLESIVKR